MSVGAPLAPRWSLRRPIPHLPRCDARPLRPWSPGAGRLVDLGVISGACQVWRTRSRASRREEADLQEQWEEFYERDERDAAEGWAIDVLEDDTLLKQILSPSPRKTRVVRPMLGDEVRVRVSGRVVDGEDLESRELGFRLGQKECFRGLEEAVMSMSQGELSRFFIAPELAYGEKGQGKVPPSATLEYEVELLKVVDMDPDVDEFDEDIEIPKDLDKMGKNDLGEGGSDPNGRYYWERHGQDMLVMLPIQDTHDSKDVDCLLLKNHIAAKVGDEVIFDGEPGLLVDEDESYWEIEQRNGKRCVCIHLRKDHEFQRWPQTLLKESTSDMALGINAGGPCPS
ncbi:unnamed protein product [Effrenium voratum]|nr:unnamed protein product [Effrenium voratum]